MHQTRYILQIVKCQNETCCEPFVTDWLVVFSDCFVPFPAIYNYKLNGPVAVKPSEYNKKQKRFEFVWLHKWLFLKKTPIAGGEYMEVPFYLYYIQCKKHCPAAYALFVKVIGPVQQQCCVIKNVIGKRSW